MLFRDTRKYKTCPALEEWPVWLWELPYTGRSRHFRSKKVSQSEMLFVLWKGRLDIQVGSVVITKIACCNRVVNFLLVDGLTVNS